MLKQGAIKCDLVTIALGKQNLEKSPYFMTPKEIAGKIQTQLDLVKPVPVACEKRKVEKSETTS